MEGKSGGKGVSDESEVSHVAKTSTMFIFCEDFIHCIELFMLNS